jgi:hypothetical protein
VRSSTFRAQRFNRCGPAEAIAAVTKKSDNNQFKNARPKRRAFFLH